MCKHVYNDLKNESRLAEQHREAADNRRLLAAVSGETTVTSIDDILVSFKHQCFSCERSLTDIPGGKDGYYLDHTLPVSWLWPLDHGPTVGCSAIRQVEKLTWP